MKDETSPAPEEGVKAGEVSVIELTPRKEMQDNNNVENGRPLMLPADLINAMTPEERERYSASHAEWNRQEAARRDVPPPDVDGVVVLDAVEAFVRKYCVLPNEHAYVAVTLWAAHTHAWGAWDTTPRLAILSAEMNSGKTRVLEVLNLLCNDPAHVMNVTTSYLFRRYEQGQPTLLVDETDAMFANGAGGKLDPSKEEIRGIINSGYRKGAVVGRSETVGNKILARDYPVFGAVALAGIKALPDTLMSRSVVIWIQRRTDDEPVSSFRQRRTGREAEPIAKGLHLWGSQNVAALFRLLDDDELDMPLGVVDRNADVWEPLLAVAQQVGGDWPKRAHEAALAFIGSHVESNETVGVELLRDIKKIFASADRIRTEELIGWLIADAETMWNDRLDARKLSKYLKPFEIAAKKIRFGEITAQGYYATDFESAWRRYVAD